MNGNSLIEKLLNALSITGEGMRIASGIVLSLGIILILGFLMTRLTKLLMDTPPVLIRRFGHFTAAVVHDLGTPAQPHPAIAAAVRDASPDLIVHGHTHVPSAEIFGGRVYVNPGSAGGLGRSGVICSAARVDLTEAAWSLHFFEIEEDGPVPFGEVLSFPFKSAAGS